MRGHMNTLLKRLDRLDRKKTLCHIDSVCDNFLFLPDGGIRLIDWEYAGMCDPMIDVSMATIYSYYNEEEAEKLLAIYCSGNISAEDRFVYYSYIALGGFMVPVGRI